MNLVFKSFKEQLPEFHETILVQRDHGLGKKVYFILRGNTTWYVWTAEKFYYPKQDINYIYSNERLIRSDNLKWVHLPE